MLKQVIVVRDDLKLDKGKMAVQVARASRWACETANYMDVQDWRVRPEWRPFIGDDTALDEYPLEKTAVVRAKDLAELKTIFTEAVEAGLPTSGLVKDLGLTGFIPRGSITCFAIGPADEAAIDKITKRLRLV
jgi:PTH2 family peptidyl-tRNA hydrolase